MTVEMSDGTAESLTVPETGPVVIGRDPSCHVVLPSPDVSRRHLTVEKGPAGYRLTDASANGTLVGEGHLHRSTCDAPGGIPLRVGPYVIRLAELAIPRQAPPAGEARASCAATAAARGAAPCSSRTGSSRTASAPPARAASGTDARVGPDHADHSGRGPRPEAGA